MTRLFSSVLMLLVAAFLLGACGAGPSPEPTATGALDLSERQINAVATTGMIADAVRNVGGERVTVTALMGPGVDPHLYKASASDVTLFDNADIIFYNGLELEGRLSDVLVKMARSRPTVAVAEEIAPDKLRQPSEFEGKYDPHIWFDVSLWQSAVATIEKQLGALDPASKELYARNSAAYLQQLKELDAYVKAQIERIPARSRVLITAHDAFGYFGERYGVEVRGLQGTSTATEAGAADVQRLADVIVERQVKAIFVESSVPEATIKAVQAAVAAKGHQVAIGGQLFSDAMGASGTPEGVYIGMVRANVDRIVTALA